MNQENNIGKVVGTCFIRICKDNDKYDIFRKRMNPKKGVFVNAWGTPCSNIFETFETNEKQIKECVPDNKNYRMIVELVNKMLQFYLDKDGEGREQPQNLQKIGAAVFNMSCFKLYGQKFLDDLANQSRNKPSFEDFCKNQWKQFCKQSGQNVAFSSFVSHFKNQLSDIYNNI